MLFVNEGVMLKDLVIKGSMDIVENLVSLRIKVLSVIVRIG